MNRSLPIAMLGVALLLGACSSKSESDAVRQDTPSETVSRMPIEEYPTMEMPLETIEGDTIALADLGGKALLLVNTASECGYTPQYKGLQELYEAYHDSGLVVVGFPANNFGNQEPGSNDEIKQFCETRFSVTFPMMAKVSVKGRDKHPLYVRLTEGSSQPGEIKWNFEKFLISNEGDLVARFGSAVTPLSDTLTTSIRRLL